MSIFGGSAFVPRVAPDYHSIHRKEGGHYNTFSVREGAAMGVLREFFPDGKANDMNFVLFSTSGVHGSYTTLDEIAAGLEKYGDDPDFGEESWPEDFHGNDLTFLIVQPRVVSLWYGNCLVTKADVPYLQSLRDSSRQVVQTIGG